MIKEFGIQPNQNKDVPMAQLVMGHDVLNGLTLWAEMLPITAAEQKVAQQYLPLYQQDMLLLYDRGFPGFTTVFFLHQNKENLQPFECFASLTLQKK